MSAFTRSLRRRPRATRSRTLPSRRAIFSDVRVREAILQLFDFEWLNRTYFFSLYKRTASYFDGCDLSAHGMPANARERELLLERFLFVQKRLKARAPLLLLGWIGAREGQRRSKRGYFSQPLE